MKVVLYTIGLGVALLFVVLSLVWWIYGHPDEWWHNGVHGKLHPEDFK